MQAMLNEEATTQQREACRSQLRRVGVLVIVVAGLVDLEDDQQDDENACIDEVAPALHAEGQHHLRVSPHCSDMLQARQCASASSARLTPPAVVLVCAHEQPAWCV